MASEATAQALVAQPVKEYATLRNRSLCSLRDVALKAGEARAMPLPRRPPPAPPPPPRPSARSGESFVGEPCDTPAMASSSLAAAFMTEQPKSGCDMAVKGPRGPLTFPPRKICCPMMDPSLIVMDAEVLLFGRS